MKVIGDTVLKMEGAALSAPVDEEVLTEQNPPLSETRPSVSEVAAGVSAADAASGDQPGAYAAGTPASTLMPEPMTATPPEAPAPTYAPVSAVFESTPPAICEMEGAALSAPVDEEVLTEQNPPLSETRPSVSEVAAGVPGGRCG